MTRRVVVEDIEPSSVEDLFNRADVGCELCQGRGRILNRRRTALIPCPCTQERTS